MDQWIGANGYEYGCTLPGYFLLQFLGDVSYFEVAPNMIYSKINFLWQRMERCSFLTLLPWQWKVLFASLKVGQANRYGNG